MIYELKDFFVKGIAWINIIIGIVLFFGSMIGCSFAEQEGLVPDDFHYPDSPTIIEYEEMQIAPCLCGVIKNVALDELEDVLIELINAQTSQRIKATLSTATGQFYLDHTETGKGPFLLKLSKPGYNTVLLRVLLDLGGHKKLIITLPFS